MKPEYSKELLAEMWKKLNLAREFETRVQWLFSMGLVHGTTHLGIGEEATVIDHAVEYGKACKNPSVDGVFDDAYA